MEKMDQFFASSCNDTRSATIALTTTFIPAHPIPCNALPNNNNPHALVGAPVHTAPPTIAAIIHP
jgi:hypothetical protein